MKTTAAPTRRGLPLIDPIREEPELHRYMVGLERRQNAFLERIQLVYLPEAGKIVVGLDH